MVEKAIEKIKKKFENTKTPYYFVSPTNFNLIDMHKWVPEWINISLVNCFDNKASHCFLPGNGDHRVFSSMEEVNEYLLDHIDSDELIKSRGEGKTIFLFFNKKLENRVKELNQELILPSNELVKGIDNKITTTEIGNEVEVYSVPNFLSHVSSYESLMKQAKDCGIGEDLVIQTAYGDSGKTTFFVSSVEDYDKSADKIEAEEKVKVMKRINCVGGAIEACATSTGTFVGPLLGELIGFEEITPYKGGWCGNELYEDQFDLSTRSTIHAYTERLGEALYRRGYKGYFEVDYLIDLDSKDIYLGEINPRITGITAMTNTSPFCQKTIPLFLFHLLEFENKPIEIAPKDYNSFSLEHGAEGVSGQIVIKSTHEGLKKVQQAPMSGIYKLVGDELIFHKESSTPGDKGSAADELYLLRIIKKDEYTYLGADEMILFLNDKITSERGTELNEFARKVINASRKKFKTRDLTEEELALTKRFTSPSNTKGSE